MLHEAFYNKFTIIDWCENGTRWVLYDLNKTPCYAKWGMSQRGQRGRARRKRINGRITIFCKSCKHWVEIFNWIAQWMEWRWMHSDIVSEYTNFCLFMCVCVFMMVCTIRLWWVNFGNLKCKNIFVRKTPLSLYDYGNFRSDLIGSIIYRHRSFFSLFSQYLLHDAFSKVLIRQIRQVWLYGLWCQ